MGMGIVLIRFILMVGMIEHLIVVGFSDTI